MIGTEDLEYVIRHWSREESTCSLNRVKFITSIRFIYQSQHFLAAVRLQVLSSVPGCWG